MPEGRKKVILVDVKGNYTTLWNDFLENEEGDIVVTAVNRASHVEFDLNNGWHVKVLLGPHAGKPLGPDIDSELGTDLGVAASKRNAGVYYWRRREQALRAEEKYFNHQLKVGVIT